MPESPIRKLVPFAEKAKQKGVKVFHLNIGQPDIETPPAAIEAVRNSKIKVLAYSKSEGDIELRDKICIYYSNNLYFADLLLLMLAYNFHHVLQKH